MTTFFLGNCQRCQADDYFCLDYDAGQTTHYELVEMQVSTMQETPTLFIRRVGQTDTLYEECLNHMDAKEITRLDADVAILAESEDPASLPDLECEDSKTSRRVNDKRTFRLPFKVQPKYDCRIFIGIVRTEDGLPVAIIGGGQHKYRRTRQDHKHFNKHWEILQAAVLKVEKTIGLGSLYREELLNQNSIQYTH